MTDQLLVRDVMSRNILECLPSETIQNVAQRMANKKCSSILIVQEGRALGIWTEKDALKINFDEPNFSNIPISELMSSPVKTISGNITLENAEGRLSKRWNNRVPSISPTATTAHQKEKMIAFFLDKN